MLTGYDELYLYDGLNRLKDQIRGTLNGTQTAITTRTFQQQWGLDATGNWQAFNQDTDGNGTWDLVQSRTTNKANETTAFNNTTGTAWVTPGYDKAGNMIGIPNPAISSTATYDAWKSDRSQRNFGWQSGHGRVELRSCETSRSSRRSVTAT